MKDLDNSFAKMRSEVDKDKVSASVRKEAMGPTRDAIKVCLLKKSFWSPLADDLTYGDDAQNALTAFRCHFPSGLSGPGEA